MTKNPWSIVVQCLLLVCCAAIGPMLSCRSGQAGGSVIRFWALGAEGDNVRALLPEFNRRHPEITVIVQAIPWTAAHEKLLTSYAGNSMPDVFQLGNTWIPEFQVLHAIEDLRPWLSASADVRASSYFPGVWNANVLESALLGIPWYVDTRVLYYRTDLLAAVGYPRAPRTWKEWLDVSRKLKSAARQSGKDAYAILLPTNEWAPPVILGMQGGSGFLKERNTLGAFSDPPFRSSFEYYANFFREDLAPVGVTQVTNIFQGFTEGFFAMYITGPWNIGEFARRLPPEMQDKWMTAPLPGPDSTWPGASLAGGSSLAMTKSASNKEAAWQLIEYLSLPSTQLAFYHITGDLPARKEAWEDSSLRGNLHIQAFYQQLANVVPVPQVPEWEQIATKVQQYSELASRNTVTLTEVLHGLDHDVNGILEKRRWLVYGK